MDDTHPLDEPQEFTDATSYRVRDELEKLVRRDLLGPWDGPQEEFGNEAGVLGPSDRYLVGRLGPRPDVRSVVARADELTDTEIGAGGDTIDGDLPQVQTPQSLGKLWASSMGMRFVVADDVDTVAVRAEWGRYVRRQVETQEGRRTVWAREPVEPPVAEIRLDAPPDKPLRLDDGVDLDVLVRPDSDRRVVELALINRQPEPASTKDTAWLFQSELTVTALDGGRAIFRPVDEVAGVDPATENHEDVHLRLLYRKQKRYALGRNVAVHADVDKGEVLAHRLTTTWLPAYDVPITEAPPPAPDSRLAGVELSMDALAAAEPDRLRAGLLPLADGYSTWLDEREAELDGIDPPLRDAGRIAIRDAREAERRLRAGVDLLTDPERPRHGEALKAFRFANLAMAAQRRHTEIGRRRDARPDLSYPDAKREVEDEGPKHATWRPFQLAFVLLNLPALTDPEHPERVADSTGLVDLLFFPTGGGKTEAYLGLTAYTFAIRRLQGTVGQEADARGGEAGVAVLMRYTLRLLTAQQFQRAAALVCAAETLRQQDETTWGTTPFRIGLWVGGRVSPNWYDEAVEQINEARNEGKNWGNVLQTLACPWCGTALRSDRDLSTDDATRRVLLHCPNGEGADACPFSKRRNADGLPVLTVDEEIHRYAPSLVVATVDKLAQLPWQGHAGILFGRVREWCPRHGYRHPDLNRRTKCATKHPARRGLPAVRSEPVARLRPPDLIIQDELHLISGALGTTVGLFEAAVDELCTWRPSPDHEAGPKIVASTATTKRAREQVLGVFARDLAVFPPPVIDITDTFFSRQVPPSETKPGRRYLGVCAHGTRLKAAEIRLAAILLRAGQQLFDTYGDPADPYLTLVSYFNATRELAGMRRLLEDDVATRLRRGYRGELPRRLGRTEQLTLEELTSRISSGDISQVLKRLDQGFDPALDTTARRQAMIDDYRTAMADAKSQTARRRALGNLHRLTQRGYDRKGRPIDVVLATSMLQVGVDVSRFGLMVVTGQPKNTAEYIQASSRVGRARPGLVVTLYNWSRPRDLAHYEDFEPYHATFYRQVEALSVTPYTRRALDRGTAATFVAAVRQSEEAYSPNPAAQDVPLDGPLVQRIAGRMLARAEAVGQRRGREYLDERLKRLRDCWEREKAADVALGYEERRAGGQQVRGLLVDAGKGPWGDLTVGRSMRETENEINLLIPGGGKIFEPLYGAQPWSFAPPPSSDDGEDGELDE